MDLRFAAQIHTASFSESELKDMLKDTMRRFTPPEFDSEAGDGCPVCLTVEEFDNRDTKGTLGCVEESLKAYQRHLYSIGLLAGDGDCPEVKRQAGELFVLVQDLVAAFYDMVVEYRASFRLELAIYYTVQIRGRLHKEPELLNAADKCRSHATQMLVALDTLFVRVRNCHGSFESSPQCSSTMTNSFKELEKAYAAMQSTAYAFWAEVDAWAKRRRQTALETLTS